VSSVRLVLECVHLSTGLVQCVPELGDDFDHRSQMLMRGLVTAPSNVVVEYRRLTVEI